MDVKDIERAVRGFLRHRAEQRPRPRYVGTAFGATSENDVQTLLKKLEQFLIGVTVWQVPGINDAPRLPISRIEFNMQVFGKVHEAGLLLYRPDEWMTDWSDADRRVFWANLAETFGRGPVYVVFAATAANLANMGMYFKRFDTNDLGCAIYTSKYEA